MLHNHSITHSLLITVEIAVANTLLVILDRRARRLRLRLARLPGPRLDLHRRDRAARRAAADGADPDVHALQPRCSLYDTVLGIVLFHVAFGLPFAIFLLRNFFVGIPKDIMESARIDGASELRIFCG